MEEGKEVGTDLIVGIGGRMGNRGMGWDYWVGSRGESLEGVGMKESLVCWCIWRGLKLDSCTG
jgi:hypothetical protein